MASGDGMRPVRFGAFEFDPLKGELRKHGIRLRLQSKPIEVLSLLVQRPGQLITREELRRHLWPENTFVDFEQGLNSALHKLRAALGDSASSPRFLETVPKRGYVFIAPVESVEPEPLSFSAPSPVEATQEPEQVDAAAPQSRPWRRPVAAAAGLLLASVIVLATYAGTRMVAAAREEQGPKARALASLDYLERADQSLSRSRDLTGQAVEEARRALETDPHVAEPHLVFARLSQRALAWEDAEHHLKQALEKDPESSRVWLEYARQLALSGRLQEALEATTKAQQLDPTSPEVGGYKGMVLYFAARFEEATIELRSALHRDPKLSEARFYLSEAMRRQGREAEAAQEFELFLDSLGVDEDELALVHEIARQRGMAGIWKHQLNLLCYRSLPPGERSFKYARAYALLGQEEAAMLWLQEAVRQRAPQVLYLKVDPDFAALHDDPRFTDLLKDLRLAS